MKRTFKILFNSKFRKYFFCVALLLPFFVNGQSVLNLDVTNAKTIGSSLATSSNASVAMPATGAISALAVSGSVVLKNNKSFVRILLQDNKGVQYLVHEANSLSFDGFSGVLKNVAEETYSLPNVTPSKILIEVNEASFTLSEISYNQATTQSFRLADNSADSLRYKQALAKVEILNAQIKKKGQKWLAGVTPISLFTYEQKKNLFKGTMPNLQGAEYYKGGIFVSSAAASGGTSTQTAATKAAASPYISSFDWRNRHGQFWLTSVKDQGGCGSCWAFTTTATTEQLVNLYYNRHLNLDLSEQEILSCSQAGNCTGGYPDIAFDYIKNTGITNNSCLAYTATDLPCANKCTSPTEKIKIGDKQYFDPATSTEDNLKAMIIKGPVSGGIYSWSHALNLVGYKTIEVGDVVNATGSMILPGDTLIGRTMWILKNSWGTAWGDNGYMYLVTNVTDIGWTYGITGPVTSPNYTVANINCTDADGDGYYFWGVGTKPAHCPPCPAEADGDDSNPNLGPMNQYGYCSIINTVSYSLTTSASNGTIQLSPAGGQYVAGTVVTATAMPNVGYKFSAWSGSVTGSVNPATVTMTANKTVTATFTKVPVVSITAPANNASFVAPANVTITANASFNGGTIAKVEFFYISGLGMTKLGEDLTVPYSYSWNNLAIGSYTLVVRATSSTGIATDASASFGVVAPNTPPTVSIVSPSSGIHYAAPATFEIVSSPNDNEGPIAKVEFYQNGVLIGTDAFYPGHSWPVYNLPAGTYTYYAKAYDGGGLTATSAPITVIVDAASCLLTEVIPPVSQYSLKNTWGDINSGANLAQTSDALKITQRAYGQDNIWVMKNTTIALVSGKAYAVKFDFKDFAGYPVSGIEVGLSSGTDWAGPLLIQAAVPVPAGFSATTFTTKSVSFTAASTGNAYLVFKLKWAAQPNVQVSDYLKNISVCSATSSVSQRSEDEMTENMSDAVLGGGMMLSPNPTESLLSLVANFGTEVELDIFDATGNRVLNKHTTVDSGTKNVQVDVHNFVQGLYSILVKSNGNIWKETFVKQ